MTDTDTLKALRRSLNLSQFHAACLCEVSHSSVARWERGLYGGRKLHLVMQTLAAASELQQANPTHVFEWQEFRDYLRRRRSER